MDLTILQGDCREKLRELPDGSVHCCVTSPPYWGLRDYQAPAQVWGGDTECDHEWGDTIRAPWANDLPGPNGRKLNSDAARQRPKETGPSCQKCDAWRGSLGLEPTPELFVRNLVLVFREVRRVLRDDGTLWLNLGDSYAGSWGNYGGQNRGNGKQRKIKNGSKAHQQAYDGLESWRPPTAGDLGPGLKPKDLVGIPWMTAFALRMDGWFLRQDIIWSKPNPMPESVADRCTKAHEYIFLLSKSQKYFYDQDAIAERLTESSVTRLSQNIEAQAGSVRVQGKTNGAMKAVGRIRGVPPRHAAYESSDQSGLDTVGRGQGRNKRSVWTVATRPYPDAHFATYPPELIKPCILAGCPAGGVVLDPFFGAGTTGLVALQLGRSCIGIELNPEYVELARKRLDAVMPLFAQVDVRPSCDNKERFNEKKTDEKFLHNRNA